MQNIQQIEKRRRELHYVSLFLIYSLALIVVGLFFFIDRFAGFVGTLQYNVIFRALFVGLIVVFIVYLAQKERLQAKLTGQIVEEAAVTSDRLRKELRNNKFLADIGPLVGSLDDDGALKQLFDAAQTFFKADGGAVILRDKGKSWKVPLVLSPANRDQAFVGEITKIIGKTGRAFVQPQPEYPDHRQIKGVHSIIAVPLRLEERLYGLIAFWSNKDVLYDQHDLTVIELIARETAHSEFSIEQKQEKTDQFRGLLKLIADAGDEKAKTKKRTELVIEQARAIAAELKLDEQTVTFIETAAYLRHVDLVTEASKTDRIDAAMIVSELSFPQGVVDALTGANGGSVSLEPGSAPLSAQVLGLSELYVTKAFPQRGRRPSPKNALAKLEPIAKDYDREVFEALVASVGTGVPAVT